MKKTNENGNVKLEDLTHWLSSSNLGIDLYISEAGTIHDANDPELDALSIEELEANIIHWLDDGTEELTDESSDGDWGWIRRNWPKEKKMDKTMHVGYVINNETVYVQIPSDNQWGFAICDEDQTWAGGFGLGGKWTAIKADDPRITDADRERLQWILDELGE